MSASSLVAEAVWKEIESTHSAILDVTEKCIQMLLMQPQLQSQCGCRNPMFLHVLVAIMGVACFLKPCFKLLTHDPRPSYFHVTVNDDQLWTLHFLFGKNFEGATRIVDQRGVSKISAHPSGRFIFQVTGESRRKDQYLCFAENFCACYSFFYDVVNRGEQLCCKHQLAARLAASLGSYVEVKVSDEELAVLLSKV
ncbi:hypothetical protein AAZX31_06G301600 [Glycine max]|uniref:SWIM-type domain-containing protein n=2 Tax=Glycine max TaxID=3847 RepID=A0A0R0JZV9_SOYBN|nr:zinc finger SWIM domain-containing protein 7 isoform X1 [Glycine max]XP_006582427.1 zinc finger SWIM domain-containing protein 7 isoform X1 [Glycine max]KAH1128579.1 hypothetical protein GYH30_016903 [Glycine max]KAH1248281.1 Zinc finger SWIM domain-containing protein 7 [Glycine max]KAH1248282.1 Zinc finger SWIM domain-containing protein 7 [Glycine max]KRH56415.1 hypothetical protein GLYMA_06G322800v4 [Glycine max]|eukprot:XP_006582426.1 zinc finger SWIM domain-containing protein 7 isoform X1 [Glycine max]